MKILILANNDVGLYKFRKELLERLVAERHRAYVSLPDGEFIPDIKKIGCKFVRCSLLDRHGTNPFQDLKLLNYYKYIIKRIKPSIVFTYTIKPNVYGGIACSELKVPYVVNVTGLGNAIENPGPLQVLTTNMYRLSLRNARMVFFQNQLNEKFFEKHHIVKGRHQLLPGSGVNTSQYKYQEYTSDNNGLIFTTVGRIMKDKGTLELLQAAKLIRKKHSNVHFRLIGDFDESLEETVNKAVDDGIIEYLGSKSDVSPYYKESHAIIHPSYHEGMSNVLLEAASTGRPVLASNIPGCRETFDEGVSGLGFEPKNVESLVSTIEKFISLPYEKKVEMGKAGRAKVEKEFDRQIVVDKYMQEIESI